MYGFQDCFLNPLLRDNKSTCFSFYHVDTYLSIELEGLIKHIGYSYHYCSSGRIEMVKHDFVRHVVNPVLSEMVKSRHDLASAVDEIKRFVANAEVRYGFSIYGGNPVKLCDYLGSNDFKILVNLFESINSLDALLEIMKRAKKSYRDLEEVYKCVDKALKRVKKRYSKGEEGLNEK